MAAAAVGCCLKAIDFALSAETDYIIYIGIIDLF